MPSYKPDSTVSNSATPKGPVACKDKWGKVGTCVKESHVRQAKTRWPGHLGHRLQTRSKQAQHKMARTTWRTVATTKCTQPDTVWPGQIGDRVANLAQASRNHQPVQMQHLFFKSGPGQQKPDGRVNLDTGCKP